MIRSVLITSCLAFSLVANAQSWTGCGGTSSTMSVNDFYYSGSSLLACSPNTEPVLTSADDGGNFSAVTTKPASYGAYTNIISNGSSLFILGRDTYESTDGGANWTKKGSFAPGVKPNDAVFYHGAIFAATNAGVMRSADGGNTYSAASSGLVNNNVNDILVHNDALYITTLNTGVYKSTDDGATWTSVKSNLPTGSFSNRITASGTNLYFSEYGAGLFISANDGGSWTNLSATPSTAIVSLLPVGDKLVVGCAAGKVFYTSDNGTTFTSIDLPSGVAICQRLYFNNNYLYAGTDAAGAYRAATTWGGTSFVSSASVMPSFNVYPNPGSGAFYFRAKSDGKVQIADLTGRVIYRSCVSSGESLLDISSYPAGTYLLTLEQDGTVSSKTLIKK